MENTLAKTRYEELIKFNLMNPPTLEKIKELKKEFEEIGFGNQAVIVGTKRVELWSFISSVYQTAFNQGREEERKELIEQIESRLPSRQDPMSRDEIFETIDEILDSLNQK